MKYDSRERFTFAQIADKMEDLNVKAPGTAPSAPPISVKAPEQNQESIIQRIDEYLPPQSYDESGLGYIEPSDLIIGKQLGKGSFGEVFECFLSTNDEMKLAIKFRKAKDYKNSAQRDEFDKEISLEISFMKSLAHQYVVQLYG